MKILLLLTFAFCFSTFAFAQQYGWVDISANLPEQVGLNDIHVIGDEIWITGGNDKVYYSPNGGVSFAIQNLPPQPGNSGITSSIFMKNNQEGYVVTYSGEINKTENGGTTWTTLHEPGGAFYSVHFPPTLDIGYTCGSNGKIYAFTDTSIVDMSVEGLTATLQSIFFPVSSSEGKLCGDSSIRRFMNGIWNNLQIFDNRFFYNSIFFTDNNTGWVVGSHGKIFKTVDATIWNGQRNTLTNGLNDVFFIDALEGWTVGSQVLLHTVDGGENWTREIESLTSQKELRAIYFTSANNGYIVGNGTLLKYTELTTGIIDKKETTQFKIYPNPVAGKFKIQSSKFKVENATIELYDFTGKKILEKQIPAGTENEEIDVSTLNSGMYFCKIQFGDACVTKKIVVKQ